MSLQQVAPSIIHAMIRYLSHNDEFIANQAIEVLAVIGLNMGSSFKAFATPVCQKISASKVQLSVQSFSPFF